MNLSASNGDGIDPQISTDGAGRALATWVFDDSGSDVVQSSWTSDGGDTWSEPVDLSVASPYAGGAQVSFDSNGRAIAVWIVSEGTDYIVQSRWSPDGGETWSSPVDSMSAIGSDAIAPQVGFDSIGRAVAMWSRDDGVDRIIESRTSLDGGETWLAPVVLSVPIERSQFPQVGFDSNGRTIAVWESYDGVNTFIQSSFSTDGGVNWSDPVDVSALGGEPGATQIGIDGAGRAVVVWVQKVVGEFYVIRSSWSSDGGENWSPPVDLSATGQDANSPHVIFDSLGRAIALWPRDNGLGGRIVQASTSVDGGVTWSTPIDVSAESGIALSPQVGFDPLGRAIAVWDDMQGLSIVKASSFTFPDDPILPDTGASSATVGLLASVSAGLLIAGALALGVVRRRLRA